MARMDTRPFEHDSQELLAWYDAKARALPWRILPDARQAGAQPDPYAVWLSEIMLQQTTVPHAAPYYLKFLGLWPTVDDLAAAPLEDVLREWAGLGYYARARNLHKCAVAVSSLGGFPASISGLLALPGIGPYTASAVGAIAFDLAVAPVDGNVERVMSRRLAIAGDGTPRGWAQDKKQITAQVQDMVPPDRPGDFAQALMDLGATVCTPRSPDCSVCPWTTRCLARMENDIEAYPAKPRKKPQPTRRGTAFVLVCDGRVLLHRRPPRGLLGGMLMPPSTPWTENDLAPIVDHQPISADWRSIGAVRHVFTHFILELNVVRADLTGVSAEGEWSPVSSVLDAGIPTVGRKALQLALQA